LQLLKFKTVNLTAGFLG